MCAIDLDKYKLNVCWVTDDKNYNFINKKVDTTTNKIVEQKMFVPLRLIIKIFPINPYETIYEMSTSTNKSHVIGSSKSKKISIPKEKQVVYQPYKIEIGTNDNADYIIKKKNKTRGLNKIEATVYDMDYRKMIDDAKLEIQKKFENGDDIIPKILEKIENSI